MRRALVALLLIPLMLVAACSGGKSSTGAPPGEDKALDEAAASLDANAPESNTTEIIDDDSDSGNQTQ